MSSRGARVARGSAAASVSTLVAAVGHTAGGGSFPSPAILAFVFAFTALICIALAGRVVSPARTAVSVLLSQAAFHLTFSLPTGSGSSWAGGAHHHELIASGSTAEPMASHLTAGMLLAHLTAAAITATALVHGERALWGLLESARLALSALMGRMPVAVVAAPTASSPIPLFTAAPLAAHVLSSVSRRGPPANVPLPL